MSDGNASLPIKTENNGDVVAQLADGTIPSQKLAIDASGNASVKVKNVAADPASVEVIVSGAAIDPRSIRALTNADIITAEQGAAASISGAWPVKPTDGTNSQGYTAASEAKVSVTQPLPAGSNSIGTVLARLEDGAGNAISSSAAGATRPIDAALRDSSGGLIDPRLIRALTSSDVVTANIKDSGGSSFSLSNPLPVILSDSVSGSSEVLDPKKAIAVASGSSDTHTYTITAGKALKLQKVFASAVGKIKVEIKLGTIGAEVSKVVMFNSVANPNCEYVFHSPQSLPDTKDVLVVITNLDPLAHDVYSTIEGYEV